MRLATLGLSVIVLIPHLPAQTGRKGDAAAGKDVFEAQCLSCHNADSTEPKEGPGLKGVKNGKLPSGAPATRDEILDLINSGRDAMPSFRELLTDRQKEDVIAYVLTL